MKYSEIKKFLKENDSMNYRSTVVVAVNDTSGNREISDSDFDIICDFVYDMWLDSDYVTLEAIYKISEIVIDLLYEHGYGHIENFRKITIKELKKDGFAKEFYNHFESLIEC